MGIESILPVPNLADLFITMFIFFIIVGSRRVINVIPVRHHSFITILLPLFSSTSLPLLSPVEPIDIIIIING
jgi:hypothetical protein